MGCRIGISTDSDERKEHWETIYKNLHDWQIFGGPFNKTKAQKEETRLAKKYGCESHPGGEGLENDDWYVYGFNHDGKKKK